MAELQIIISVLMVLLGILFMLAGSIGILRLPDFYSRTHATSKSDTLGIIFVIVGLIIFNGFTQSSLKLLLVAIFIALSNPIGSHALSRAAYKNGLAPFFNKKNTDKEDTL